MSGANTARWDAATPAPGAAASVPPPAESSYAQILKSSALIGGSTLVTVLLGMVRTKFVAVMLGPTGFGLMGLYTSLADLVRAIAAMGLSGAGVRQIAAAAASGDAARVAHTATVIRRVALGLGLLGAVLMVGFARPLSQLTFGDTGHAGAVALLSLVVLFGVVGGAQFALIQGLRRVGDLAWSGILGALAGVVLGLPLIAVFGADGVVPSLVVVAAVSLASSWWFSRRLARRPDGLAPLAAPQARREAAALLKLGFSFMASGVLMMGVGYAVRLIVLRKAGLEAAGLYQSSWTLGGLYVGFVLQAMGADFYPRLVGAAADDPRGNRLVNEQARVGLLLAGPGVLATITLAPLAVTLFYSASFGGAVEILRWICLGMALRVLTWPMGFIIVAKARQGLFLATELAWSAVAVALAWVLVDAHGAVGAGMAFFGSYVFHALMIYPIVRRLSGFRWSAENVATGFACLGSIGAVFAAFVWLPVTLASVVGVAATVLSAVLGARALARLVSTDALPPRLARVLARLRLTPAPIGGA